MKAKAKDLRFRPFNPDHYPYFVRILPPVLKEAESLEQALALLKEAYSEEKGYAPQAWDKVAQELPKQTPAFDLAGVLKTALEGIQTEEQWGVLEIASQESDVTIGKDNVRLLGLLALAHTARHPIEETIRRSYDMTPAKEIKPLYVPETHGRLLDHNQVKVMEQTAKQMDWMARAVFEPTGQCAAAFQIFHILEALKSLPPELVAGSGGRRWLTYVTDVLVVLGYFDEKGFHREVSDALESYRPKPPKVAKA